MEIPLIKYRLIIQHFEQKQASIPDRATLDMTFNKYKVAKKECIKKIRSLQRANREIISATITPVMLSETFYDGSQE